MTERTWADVELGWYIVDHNGKMWRVDGLGKVKVRLVDADQTIKTIDRPAPTRPVRVAFIQSTSSAIGLLESTLGATIIEEIPTHADH